MKSLSIIGIVGVPACYGGFETLAENLLSANECEQSIRVYCSSRAYPERLKKYKNAHLYYIPLCANGSQSVLYDVWSLLHASFKGTDNILILGVSGAICLPILRVFSKANLVTNIDGLEWRRDKWGLLAKKFLKYSEKIAVKYSDVIVADNQSIADYLLDEYGCKSEVIAYGGDHAITSTLTPNDDGYALALCRIEPENNIELILEGFKCSKKTLKFIGNWESSEFGCRMKVQYTPFDNIEIIDPIYDLDTLFEIRQNCSFYVHGHSAGGTNPSLVEMMHFGKHILSFDCNYNRATTENSAEYFCNVDELIIKIANVEAANNGVFMMRIAQRRYTWRTVKEKYFNLLVRS